MEWPIPQITDETEAFWTGGREGRLMISRCADCGFLTQPPTPRCPGCFSENVAPSQVSGRGTVYSFTINRQAWIPGLEVPYVVATVALEEQSTVRILTNIVGCPADEVIVGMPVEVEFEERGDAFLPMFRKAAK